MDKLIEHLFSLNIPSFFLALALLYELAISLKLKFGRSWLYKEIRDNLQNPAARKLLMHDLRARPNLANLKYVRLLLGSHRWLDQHLDGNRRFNHYRNLLTHRRDLTQSVLPLWRQRIRPRTWYTYMTGRSFVLCFAIATFYPLVLFLMRFAISGDIELADSNAKPSPVSGRWLLPFIFLASVILLFSVRSYSIKNIVENIIHIAFRHRSSNDTISWILLVGSALLLLINLYYSEIIIANSSLTAALFFVSIFVCFCAACIIIGESLLSSLLSPLIFAFACISIFIGINLAINSIATIDSPPILILVLVFIIALFISFFSFMLAVDIYKKNKYEKIIANTIRLITMAILLATYLVLYFVSANDSSNVVKFIISNSLINELSIFLLLAIALPPINALLDWLSLALSRYCFDKVLLHSRWTQWIYITLDLMGAIVTLVLLYTLIFWVLGRFGQLFPDSVGDVAAMRDLWWRSPWHPDVLWITIMGATTMLMTLLHILTSLYGLFFWLPQDLRQRRRYARQLAAEAKRVPILPGEKYPASELHHQIAHFLTIGRDRTIVWGFCIGGAMLSWIINLFYPHIPFLSV